MRNHSHALGTHCDRLLPTFPLLEPLLAQRSPALLFVSSFPPPSSNRSDIQPCLVLKVRRLVLFVRAPLNLIMCSVGTPKYLANQMKSKGLQRLRWYCQVCEKQCRDENGFKCHAQSESHLRQMLVVGENAGRHISDYSMQFQHDFVTLLSRRCASSSRTLELELCMIDSFDSHAASARSASRPTRSTRSSSRTSTISI